MLNTRANKFKVSSQKQWIKKDNPTLEYRWHHNNLPLLKIHILYTLSSYVCSTFAPYNYLLLTYTFPSIILHPYKKTTEELLTYMNIPFSTLWFFKGHQTNSFLEIEPVLSHIHHLINIKTTSCMMLYYICSPHLTVNTSCLNYKNFAKSTYITVTQGYYTMYINFTLRNLLLTHK